MKAVRSVLVLAFLALPVVLAASAAQGAFIGAFSGNTFPQDTPTTLDAHVNFAVLDTTGGVAGDTWGTGFAGFDALFVAGVLSPVLDTTAQYLYLFQTVNDGDHPEAISQNTVSVPNAAATSTSFGHFSAGFTPGSNGPSAPPGDPSQPLTSQFPTIVNGAGLQVPDFVTRQANSIGASFILTNLAGGAASTLWGYTSNYAPTLGTSLNPLFASTSIQDGGTNAAGKVPIPDVSAAVPEPVTLVIWSALGLGGMGLAMVRRRKGNARSPWTDESRSAILQIVASK